VVVAVKAMACELPGRLGVPLSRLHVPDIAFEEKAARVLDLYARVWEGKPLGKRDLVISADEKTSIQARRRRHPTVPAGPGRAAHIEFEYKRGGALQYLAAWDIHRAKVFGRCEATTGIVPFCRLADQVMSVEPYASARRVFWVVDNGSSHRGQTSVERMAARWPNLHLVHVPVHASWLNQVEIYFSIVQRKVLTPNDFANLSEVEERLLAFERRYEESATSFEWKFTRKDLAKLMERLADRHQDPLPIAA
jgi:hypothetical protein